MPTLPHARPNRPVQFNIKRPCVECPFRQGQPLRIGRENINKALGGIHQGNPFGCHMTEGPLTSDTARYCVGGMHYAHLNNRPGMHMVLAAAMKLWNYGELRDAELIDADPDRLLAWHSAPDLTADETET